MKHTKKDRVQFLVWMRNGFAFCTTWILMLELGYNRLWGIQNMATDYLIKLLLFILGGVFLFCLSFSKVMIKKWSFIQRLTGFMMIITIYESFGFYWIGWFKGSGSFSEWFLFVGIAFASYLSSILVYQYHSRIKGEIYTEALREYQKHRSRETGIK